MEENFFVDQFEIIKKKIQQSLFQEALDDICKLLSNKSLKPSYRADLAYQQIATLNYIGNTKDALALAEQNLRYVNDNNLKQKLATAYVLCGRTALILSDYEKAQTFFTQAYFHAKEHKSYYSIIDALSHMGIILSITNQPREAIQKFIDSLRVIKKYDGSVVNKTDAYFRMGNILCELGKVKLGFNFINEAERLAYETQNQVNILNTLITKVHVLNSLSQYDQAMIEVKKALDVNKKFGQDILSDIINFYFCNVVLKGNLKEDIKSRIAELEVATNVETKTQNKLEYIETLILFFRKTKNYKKLDEYQEQRFLLNKEFYNETSDKNLKKLQASFDIDLLKKEKLQAEQLAKVKHDFLANMSHEIRSPMNMVLGALNLVLENKPSASQVSYLNIAKRGAENLLGIINDFLDLSKIEAGKIEIVKGNFDLLELIKDSINLFGHVAEAKGLQIEFEYEDNLPRSFFADEIRIRQIFNNLLSNAIKFTEKGKINVSVQIKRKKKTNFLLLTVKDTGIGISKNNIKKIFTEFGQAERETSRKYGGTGLGLFISKNLCHLMNGNLSIKSVLGKGSSFLVELPIDFGQIMNENSVIKHDKRLKNLNIIVADDIEDNRKILKDTLAIYSTAVSIEEAKDGQELLEKIKVRKYDLVITDLDMPIVNGFEFIREFRSFDTKTKVLGMTASLISGNLEDVLKLGFDDIIIKPFQPNQLIETILVTLKK